MDITSSCISSKVPGIVLCLAATCALVTSNTGIGGGPCGDSWSESSPSLSDDRETWIGVDGGFPAASAFGGSPPSGLRAAGGLFVMGNFGGVMIGVFGAGGFGGAASTSMTSGAGAADSDGGCPSAGVGACCACGAFDNKVISTG